MFGIDDLLLASLAGGAGSAGASGLLGALGTGAADAGVGALGADALGTAATGAASATPSMFLGAADSAPAAASDAASSAESSSPGWFDKGGLLDRTWKWATDSTPKEWSDKQGFDTSAGSTPPDLAEKSRNLNIPEAASSDAWGDAGTWADPKTSGDGGGASSKTLVEALGKAAEEVKKKQEGQAPVNIRLDSKPGFVQSQAGRPGAQSNLVNLLQMLQQRSQYQTPQQIKGGLLG